MVFFLSDPAPTEIYTLSLHDALPILPPHWGGYRVRPEVIEFWQGRPNSITRSEEHTSELQSRLHLVCRLVLEKKKAPRKAIAADVRFLAMCVVDVGNFCVPRSC